MFNSHTAVRDLLEQANSLLPKDLSSIKDKTYCTRENYKEFLVKEEFELAMEQLEGIGEELVITPFFWSCLFDVASLMGLETKATYYKSKIKV